MDDSAEVLLKLVVRFLSRTLLKYVNDGAINGAKTRKKWYLSIWKPSCPPTVD